MNHTQTGAEALRESFVAHGAKVIFGITGASILPAYDTLYNNNDQLRLVSTCHEQAAVHAANGYAQITGEPGIVWVTGGPGISNALTGIATAQKDSIPLIVVSGQVPTSLFGTRAFQELASVEIADYMTKWSCRAKNADEIPSLIDQAYIHALSGRPGPVFVDIPINLQTDTLQADTYRTINASGKRELSSYTREQLEQAKEIWRLAQKPAIIAGHGVILAGAEEELLALAEKTNTPVLNPLLGLGSFPADHYLFMSMPGTHGKLGANLLTEDADALFVFGARLDNRLTGGTENFAKQARIVQIDIDPAMLRPNAELAITADLKEALTFLLSIEERTNVQGFINKYRALNAIEHSALTRQALASNSSQLTMSETMDLFSMKTSEDTIIVADAGQHQMFVAQRYQFSRNRKLITTGGFGTMGFAVPAAIGAKIAAPYREVIAITGDGGLLMCEQEFTTMSEENVGIKIVVLNNRSYGMIRQLQDELYGGRHIGANRKKGVDFVTIAKGHGVLGRRVETRDDLEDSIKEMFAATGPYILDVYVNPSENVPIMNRLMKEISPMHLEVN